MTENLTVGGIVLVLVLQLVFMSYIESVRRKNKQKGWDNSHKDIAGRLKDLSFNFKHNTEIRNTLELLNIKLQRNHYYSNDQIVRIVKELGDKSIYDLPHQEKEELLKIL